MIFLQDLLLQSIARRTRFYEKGVGDFGSKFTPSAGAAVRDLGEQRAKHVFALRRAMDAYIFIENLSPCVLEEANKVAISQARRQMIGKHRRRIRTK